MVEEFISRFYRGNSMRNIFRPGDCLRILPTFQDGIVLGDVIAYHKVNHVQQDEEVIVHRVVAILDNELITQGDNNRYPDLVPVQWEQIIGKVKTVESMGHESIVIGGALGLLGARLHWAVLNLSYWRWRFFQRPYHILRRSGVVARLWKPVIDKLCVQTEDGLWVKYIYKRRTVAIWNMRKDKFDCRKPFDLVIPQPRNVKNYGCLD